MQVLKFLYSFIDRGRWTDKNIGALDKDQTPPTSASITDGML